LRAPLSDGLLPAKIVTLAEPLKIRSITCGPSADYWWALYIQTWLHSIMRKTKTFTLIGGTEEGSPISRQTVEARFFRALTEDRFYVSGDYQAATNLISGRLSEVAAEEICKVCDFPPHLAALFSRALTGHLISDGAEEEAPQANGQLMGSPVSFPILCLINAALTRESQELSGDIPRPTTLDDMEILINGDDVAFPTTSDGYSMWKLVTACGGLNPSIGKNYTSPHFLVMNSTLFELGLKELPRPMRSSGSRYSDGGSRLPNNNCGKFVGPDHTVLRRDVQERQLFVTKHWFNMDFLGPGGIAYHRTTKWEGVKEQLKNAEKRQEDLNQHLRMVFKKSRHHGTLTCIQDLFQAENYQILPSLQQKWLGDCKGPLRHQMNLVFLSTWREVLELGYHAKIDPVNPGLKGQVPFVIDWFLPNSLGGYGLEETSGQGIRASSVSARKLAKYLMTHDEERLPYLPCLGQQPRFALAVTERYRKELDTLKASSIQVPKTSPCPTGYREESDLVARITNEVLMEANNNVYEGIGKRGEGGDFVTDRDASISLAIGLEKCYRTRARYWRGNLKRRWQSCPPLTQRELDSWIPTRRVLLLEPAVRLKAFLGTEEEASFPLTTLEHRSLVWDTTGVMSSGDTFPANRRYDRITLDLWNQMDDTPILPFGFSEYVPVSWTEFGARMRLRGRELAEEEERKNRHIGSIARDSGGDLFGDSEFDSLLEAMTVQQMSHGKVQPCGSADATD